MTLRQILDVLWKRKWIVAAVVAIALLTAVGYLQLRAVSYASSGTIRLNAVVTSAAVSGEIGGVSIDLGDGAVLSPAVLDPAAAALGVDPATLATEVSVASDTSSRLALVTVSAVGSSPESAQAAVNAVLTSYQSYIGSQMADILKELQQRQQTAITDVRTFQKQLGENSGDPIATVNMATALSQMQTASGAIQSIADAGTSNSTVVGESYPGELTVPAPLIVLLLALATGLIMGIAVALIRDQFDNRLRSDEDVESVTGVRSIGELSWDRRLAQMDPPLPVASNERTDLSERLRTLRSNLAVFLPTREAAFVVTSVEPGDGKSFVSANLALAWARAGKKVILVGGDLRRPNLAKYFGDAADGEGLSDLLLDHEVGAELSTSSVDARITSTRYRRLRVLPSGAEPAEPADLFARPIVGELISYLRTLADVVIIDSPPAVGMADAALLASHTDGAIVLASVKQTDRVLLLETIESLRAAGTNVLGVVTNRSRRKLPKSYSSYYISGEKPEMRAPALSPTPSEGEVHLRDDDVYDDEAPLRRSRIKETHPDAADHVILEDSAAMADADNNTEAVDDKGRKPFAQ